MRTLFTLLFLLSLSLNFGCKKENSDVVRVEVLNNGMPVPNHWVNFSAGASSIGANTNADGIATIDLNGAIIDYPEDYVFFSLKPSGYTRFINKETLHTINIQEEEVIEVKVLSPDLENNIYNIGDKVDIELQITSNFIPLVFRKIIIDQINPSGEYIEYSTDNFGKYDTQPNYDGILKFTYIVHEDGDDIENTNGFFLNVPDEGFSYIQYTFMINKE